MVAVGYKGRLATVDWQLKYCIPISPEGGGKQYQQTDNAGINHYEVICYYLEENFVNLL